MSDAPERIWATEDAENYGEDSFHSKTSFPGGTEYVRADIADPTAARLARYEGLPWDEIEEAIWEKIGRHIEGEQLGQYNKAKTLIARIQEARRDDVSR